MPSSPLPCLRPTLHLVPAKSPDGEDVLVLQDTERLTPTTLALPLPLGLVLQALLDGTRDLDRIAADWAEATGTRPEPGDLESLLAKLDASLLLEGERVEAAREAALATYRSQAHRPAAHAGECYAADAPGLAAELASWCTVANVDPIRAPVCGVLAPHIDPRGGRACHGAAVAALAACEAEVFVILGTSHGPLRQPFALTTLDFETPSGPVSTDRDLVARLAARGGGDLLADERAHETEHSVEFQAAWIRALHGARPGLRIVPVLVGSMHGHLKAGTSPSTDERIADFTAALRELRREYGNRLALVASVDFAHIGPAYGHAERPTPEELQRVLDADRALLDHARTCDAEAWFRYLADEKDGRNVCGASATYLFLSTLAPEHPVGRVLRHDHWEIDPESGSYVSFAAVSYAGPGEERRA